MRNVVQIRDNYRSFVFEQNMPLTRADNSEDSLNVLSILL